MPRNNTLFTTVTLSDFQNAKYINTLIDLGIGMELALLTPISTEPTLERLQKDLSALKQEIDGFKDAFETYNIPINTIRIHQPGGYMYHWSGHSEVSGYDALKEFFSYCLTLGFEHYVIHAPYGNTFINEKTELADFKTKLENLVPGAHLEVEEIVTSNHGLTNAEKIRFYAGNLLEQLVHESQTSILLDTYECGGIEKTIQRLGQLADHGFEVKSIHLHKNKHQLLTKDEVQKLISKGYSGNLINEGFISPNSSFEEFVKTRSIDCIISNEEKIKMLKNY